MDSNFKFLEKYDNDLFKIIQDAERLYRDEYFEQCMTQTRRFGEVVCKNILGNRRTTEMTFDSMLSTLKDYSKSNCEKEFINDLYLLKRCGNDSVHSFSVKQDGIKALECLKSAYEVAINYCVYAKKGAKNILNKEFDTDLLVTGKTPKKTLQEKYTKAKTKSRKKSLSKTKKNSFQTYSVKSQKENSGNMYWYTAGISFIVSIIIVLVMIFI